MRSKKSINSNTGNTFTRLYMKDIADLQPEDLVPRRRPQQYSEKLLQSVGNATVPVKKSIERAKMIKS